MQIYFAGSIRGAEPNKIRFKRFIDHLSQYGRVLTEHSFDFEYSQEIKLDDSEIYQCDMGWLEDADILVAEVSSPSLGVGYEIGKVETMGKPILCLYQRQKGKKLSAMINGNKNLSIFEYDNDEEAIKALDDFIEAI